MFHTHNYTHSHNHTHNHNHNHNHTHEDYTQFVNIFVSYNILSIIISYETISW